MLEVKSINDMSSKWSGFHMVWDVEFDGAPLKVSKQSVVGGDEDNEYCYWSYYVRDINSDDIIYSCNCYESGYVEWNKSPIEGFDWSTFREEVKEALDIELPTK